MSIMDTLFDDPETLEDDLFEEEGYSYDTVNDDETPSTFYVRVGSLCDGATSLEVAADLLRAYADSLDSLHENGFVLSNPIRNGLGFAYVDQESS